MTTSNSIDYNITGGDAITQAFEIIGVIGEGDYLAEYDYGVGKATLNMMIKAWQNTNHHLWTKQTVTLFPQKNQSSYEISTATTDYMTADSVDETQLTVAAVATDLTITVSSITGISSGDYIGIQLDNGYWFWTTVNGAPVGLIITLTDAITSAAAIGRYVVTFTTRLNVPFQTYAASRRTISSKLDVPLNMMAYREYFDHPNKFIAGVPVMWVYDRQLNSYTLSLWPMPSDNLLYIKLIVSRKMQDIDVVNNTFDLPQEWMLAIVYNLAVMLAPNYGKAQGDNFAELKAQAALYKEEALEIDNEMGSIYIKPNYDGFRSP